MAGAFQERRGKREHVWRTVTQGLDPLLAVVIEEIEREGSGLG